MKNLFFFFFLSLSAFSVLSCTRAARGRDAAVRYQQCDGESSLLKQAECKKNVLYENRTQLQDSAFSAAFWQQVQK